MKSVTAKLSTVAMVLCALCTPVTASAGAAMAAVRTPRGIEYFWVGGQPSGPVALGKVLATCVNGKLEHQDWGDCRPLAAYSHPAYWAAFEARDGSVAVHWSETRQSAIDAAYGDCIKRYGQCPTTAAHVWFDSGQREALGTTSNKVSQVARPASRSIQRVSCTNECVNGNCVRTFSDGRREQWQAKRVYDPFTNDWKWDINSCGAE